MNKFTVFYADTTEFSGDPFNSEWKKIDDTKQIIKVQYVCGNSCIIMEGYEEYNHTLECIGLGQKGIARILLMGRTSGETEIVVLDIRQHKIYKDFKPRYREYGSQILDGWQQGKLTTPKCFFKKLPNV
jgi:hypothetical protein